MRVLRGRARGRGQEACLLGLYGGTWVAGCFGSCRGLCEAQAARAGSLAHSCWLPHATFPALNMWSVSLVSVSIVWMRRYIRYIYNRIILENATVRAAAVSALANFGAKVGGVAAATLTAGNATSCCYDPMHGSAGAQYNARLGVNQQRHGPHGATLAAGTCALLCQGCGLSTVNCHMARHIIPVPCPCAPPRRRPAGA